MDHGTVEGSIPQDHQEHRVSSDKVGPDMDHGGESEEGITLESAKSIGSLQI